MTRKPAWYAYAGGAGVSLNAPTRACRGALITLSGRAYWHGGAAHGQALVLQGRRLGTRHWYALARFASGSDGRYSRSVRFRSASQYRIDWPGVRSSATRTVRVP